MPKSKKTIDDRLQANKTAPHDEATEIVNNYRKSTHSRESAVLPDLGSKKR